MGGVAEVRKACEKAQHVAVSDDDWYGVDRTGIDNSALPRVANATRGKTSFERFRDRSAVP
jgi:hypothetical protein